MSCRIKLYEMRPTPPPSFESLRSSTVVFVAINQASLTNCSPMQRNRRLIGGGYGADLQFTPASFVYQVAIADTAHVYAGATVANLNGANPGDLDVVLFHLPASGVGAVAAGGTAAQMRDAVLKHLSWNLDEKQAVLSVMNAVGSLRGTTAALIMNFITHYERILADRGIDPGLF
jgi:hypothetical protein